jgi:hypothetical protein
MSATTGFLDMAVSQCTTSKTKERRLLSATVGEKSSPVMSPLHALAAAVISESYQRDQARAALVSGTSATAAPDDAEVAANIAPAVDAVASMAESIASRANNNRPRIVQEIGEFVSALAAVWTACKFHGTGMPIDAAVLAMASLNDDGVNHLFAGAADVDRAKLGARTAASAAYLDDLVARVEDAEAVLLESIGYVLV